MPPIAAALRTLVLVHFLNAALVSTIGCVQGGLRPVAWLGGLALAVVTPWAYFVFARGVRTQMGRGWLALWIVVLGCQLFWAFFKAPLDVDGMVYHLPTVLSALDENRWGSWTLPIWQIQSTPKFGEVPTLCMVTLGGPWGWRLAQTGHLSTGILGALAACRIASASRASRPALWGLAFWLSPIAVKQMTTTYVDVASWSYWLAAAAFLVEDRPQVPGRSPRPDLLACLAVTLHAGVKLSGPVTALALAPLFLRRPAVVRWGAAALVTASMVTWVVPNLVRHGNPLFPLDLAALAEGRPGDVVPAEMFIGCDFHPWAWESGAPKWLAFVSQFVIPEPIAVYDQNGGAWGFVLPWALAAIAVAASRRGTLTRARSAAGPGAAVIGCCALAFVLMPAREIPRHGYLLGFGVIAAGLVAFDALEPRPRFLARALSLALATQAVYVMGDRVMLRGLPGATPSQMPGVVWTNVADVVEFGEPQSPGRWFHEPLVPELRKLEPRTARIEEGSLHLVVVYWGRRFSNTVVIDPSYRRWPYTDTEGDR